MKAEASYQIITRQRLYEHVASQLERMICEGELADGEALPSERELIERFGVGRVTIREALLSLQQKGLVLVSNGERARVSRPDANRLIANLTGAAQIYLADEKGIRDFQGVRRMIEVAMVRIAATEATPSDIEHIGETLRANGLARGDAERFSQTDVEFHLAIAQVSRNQLILGGYKALNGWLTEWRSRLIAHKFPEEEAFAAHERIFAAIKARDPDRAEAEMRDHLAKVIAQYWSIFDREKDLK